VDEYLQGLLCAQYPYHAPTFDDAIVSAWKHRYCYVAKDYRTPATLIVDTYALGVFAVLT